MGIFTNNLLLNTEQFRQIKTILLRTISTFQNMFLILNG